MPNEVNFEKRVQPKMSYSSTTQNVHLSSVSSDCSSSATISEPMPSLSQEQSDVLEKTATAYDVEGESQDVRPTATTATSFAAPPFSVFPSGQKKFIVFVAAWAGFFSPVSASIYLPALNSLARDLHVSSSLINLTLTSYMIFQGLAPAFIGSLADSMGRRPAYFICFTIYIAANIGLALQNNYAALFLLRCLQSSGSSATIAMSSAIVSDVATPAERGKWMGFTLAGSLLGPALGPVIGGVLAQFLGWRAIFWFLVIFAGIFMITFAIFFPETARSIVGDGSIPTKGLNMSLTNYLTARKQRKLTQQSSSSTLDSPIRPTLTKSPTTTTQPPKPKARFPNPLSSLKIIYDKENALLLFYNAFLFAAFYDITAIIPSQFARIYHFNDLQIGLCYLPFGFGSVAAALINGQLLDRNFRRWCNKLNVAIKRGRDQDLRNFPIEKARLQIAIPAAYSAIVFILIFGWVLNYEGPLAVLLVILFFSACSMSLAFNVTSTLLVDFYPRRSATATAANNLVRCLLGAGATAVIVPMIDGMGLGWTFTFLALVLVATSPALWLVMNRGMKWREERRVKDEKAEQRRERKKPARVEEGKAKSEEGVAEVPIAVGGTAELAAVVEEEKERAEDEAVDKEVRSAPSVSDSIPNANANAIVRGQATRSHSIVSTRSGRRKSTGERLSRVISHDSIY